MCGEYSFVEQYLSKEIDLSTDISVEGTKVRLRDQPSIKGRTTGKTRQTGSFLSIEVELGPNKRQYYRETQIELDTGLIEPDELFLNRALGTPDDLRRRLSIEKMTGTLTDVLYSMGNSNTEFMPHQYKPVIKFIESPFGRLLIADEVGLGKTIEAIYIWQELQARNDARRLLIVCPSVLREKWKADLRQRFGIDDVFLLDAKSLWQTIEPVIAGNLRKSFIIITSLEGIRVRTDDADPESMNPRERLAGHLKLGVDINDDNVFDLVVVDEAHYLRNSTTASHQIIEILRDVSKGLILLSATPLQTSEENLFNLLRLLAPEHFTDKFAFYSQFSSNTKLIKAVNAILYGGQPSEILKLIEETLADDQFSNDPVLLHVKNRYEQQKEITIDEKVALGRSVEALSLFGGYYTRSRKRDVFENRTLRSPETIPVKLSDEEMAIYERITEQIRHSPRTGQVDVFRIIQRQRQLASSIYAALNGWKLERSKNESNSEMWEDFGTLPPESDIQSSSKKESLPVIDCDLEYLRKNDSKYKGFKKTIENILNTNSEDKIVVFSYYRATIAYLVERLSQDGYIAISLVGGMGEDRWRTIERFRDDPSIRILVSSEVGSEGIDLQFCRFLFNYDLPWNPMRLEQRIGRLDRIGQKHEKILIYNLYCDNTIEDRVIMRLYNRIEIFKNSIGDLEEILGTYIDDISRIITDVTLTKEERDAALLQSEQALEERRRQTRDLEEESIDLYCRGADILRAIDRDRKLNRLVGPEDLFTLVIDFFNLRYPQTQFPEGRVRHSISLLMSREAKNSIQTYIEHEKPSIRTALSTSDKPILCLFDPQIEEPRHYSSWERIGVTHPLIRWIISEYQNNSLGVYCSSAIQLSKNTMSFNSGIFAYLIQRWSIKGSREFNEHRYFLINVLNNDSFNSSLAEELLVNASKFGTNWYDSSNEISDDNLIYIRDNLFNIAGHLFEKTVKEYEFENNALCERQARYLQLSYKRKREGLIELVERQITKGNNRIAKMNQGKLDKLDAELSLRLERIEEHRNVDANFKDISMGLIKII